MTAAIFTLIAAGWLSTGSLVVHIEDSAVRPVAVRLEGPTSGEWPLGDVLRTTLTGLAPGAYRVRAVFAGSVADFSQNITITRAGVAEVVLGTARRGGVRFVADPGMCEPGDQWTFRSTVFVIAQHGTDKEPAGWTMPSIGTCVREVGGLQAGRYQLQVTPPSSVLPPYMLQFQVRAGEWTSVRLPHPPVVVRGEVKAGGEPVSGVRVSFRSRITGLSVASTPGLALTPESPLVFLNVPSGSDGAYVTVLPAPGTYVPEYTATGVHSLPSASADVVIQPGSNRHDVQLADARIRVLVSYRGGVVPDTMLVNVTTQLLPHPPTVQRLTDPVAGYEQRVFSPGTYTVTASATLPRDDGPPLALVASRMQDVAVRPDAATDVLIDLVPTSAMLRVVDHLGQPIEGASVYGQPLGSRVSTDDRGEVSLSTIAPGSRVVVRTRNWGITCHVVTTDAIQVATVVDHTARVSIAYPHEGDAPNLGALAAADLKRILGGAVVRGVSTATCDVPFEGFSVAETRLPKALELSIDLPPGQYQLVLRDGRVLAVTSPGRLEIR